MSDGGNGEVELWTVVGAAPGDLVGSAGRAAARAEAEGWTGVGVVDSQNLAVDPYVALTAAAAATTTIRLATAVTNPLTRHPAAAATAIASVHAASGGRAVLGIGRGDSSLAHLGLAPVSPVRFRSYLERLQAYLSGQGIAIEPGAGVESLGLAAAPEVSRIHWLPAGLAKVPVDVAASGPKVIALGATLAERVSFAVGANEARLGWAIEVARAARAAAGLEPAGLGLGAYVPVFVAPTRDEARRHISGGLASFARFSVMHGHVNGPVGESERATLHGIHDAYDMGHHFRHGSPQSAGLTDEVIDAFGIAGPPGYCADRLAALIGLGLTKIFVMGGGMGADREAVRASRRALVDDVLPRLR